MYNIMHLFALPFLKLTQRLEILQKKLGVSYMFLFPVEHLATFNVSILLLVYNDRR